MDLQQDFFTAVKAGDAQKVAELLDQDPALVNAKTESGLPAVLLATYYGHPAIAELIAGRGAQLDIFAASAIGDLERAAALLEDDPGLANAFAGDGFQPLGLAAFFGQLPLVELLLAKGAEVNSASDNAQGVMPLHSAVAHRHLEIARRLVAAGADVNAKQADDFTPLHEAAQNGQLEMAELLLEAGAQVNPRKADGKSPLGLALEYGHTQVADLLRMKGGEA
ncbi:MAG TPA: ankyrin repeat domain-containing protein [Anaerolineales bacterium]|nr:ankyrin repeat domain-containing protein [Anaerolineales bacterium]